MLPNHFNAIVDIRPRAVGAACSVVIYAILSSMLLDVAATVSNVVANAIIVATVFNIVTDACFSASL